MSKYIVNISRKVKTSYNPVCLSYFSVIEQYFPLAIFQHKHQHKQNFSMSEHGVRRGPLSLRRGCQWHGKGPILCLQLSNSLNLLRFSPNNGHDIGVVGFSWQEVSL
jgi:hypothetical protein